MTTRRLGLAGAVALVPLMFCSTTLAQDGGRKTAPKPPARTNPTPRPKAPPAPPDDAEPPPETPPAEASDEADPPADEAAADQASDDEAGDADGDAAEDSDAGSAEDAPTSDDEDAPEPPAADDASPEDATSPDVDEERPRAKRRRKHRRTPAASKKRKASPKAKTKTKKDQPPRTLEYYEGVPTPEGYAKVEETRTGLVVAGAITFGVGWLAAATAAVAASEHDGCGGWGHGWDDWDDDGWGRRHGDRDGRIALCEEGPDGEDFAPLYIPLVGPFIAMGTADHLDGSMRAAMLLDGVVQVGGAAMFIAGLAAKKTTLVRTAEVEVKVTAGPGSVGLSGSF